MSDVTSSEAGGIGTVTVRDVGIPDYDVIASLVTQLGYPTDVEHMRPRLENLRGHVDYITLVADSEGKVIGLVGAFVGFALEFDGVYGRLTGLVVDAPWRGRGIGKLLLASIEARLKQRGATQVILTSGRHRSEAHAFYRAVGYTDTGVRFMKSL